MIKNDSRTSEIPIKTIFNYSWFYRLHMVYRPNMCARIGAASLNRLGGIRVLEYVNHLHMCTRIGAASLATLARLGGD